MKVLSDDRIIVIGPFGTLLLSLLKCNRLFSCLLLIFFYESNTAQSDDSTNNKLIINSISIKGNKITKRRIITREFVKHEGDSIEFKDLKRIALRTQQNIFNTQLFIFDTVKYQIHKQTGRVDLDIKVKERWYILPLPIFEIQDRNINSWIQHQDLYRLNYGLLLNVNNVTGNRDVLSFIARMGYSERYGFAYQLPYLNKAQTIGLGFSYSLNRNHEINYSTSGNVLYFHRDYEKYMRQQNTARIGIIVRNALYQRSTLDLIYNSVKIDGIINDLNPAYFGNGRTQIGYFTLQYAYSFDKRDSKPYPLKGWTVDLSVIKEGLNYIYDESINNLYAVGSVRKYTQLYKRFYLANQIKGRYINTDKIPYYFNRALGYGDFIRGYEYYVMDGQNFLLFKNALKYQLLKTKIFEPKYLRKIPQFGTIPLAMYVNLNFDAGYVQDKFYGQNNPLTNSWQYGFGAGLDLVTYYDVVFRIEYSFNKLMQSGFFFHFSAAI